jgi:hypothetical protein
MWYRLGYSAMKTHFIVIYVVIFVVTDDYKYEYYVEPILIYF